VQTSDGQSCSSTDKNGKASLQTGPGLIWIPQSIYQFIFVMWPKQQTATSRNTERNRLQSTQLKGWDETGPVIQDLVLRFYTTGEIHKNLMQAKYVLQ